jgi:hypothetical protein
LSYHFISLLSYISFPFLFSVSFCSFAYFSHSFFSSSFIPFLHPSFIPVKLIK